jgi:hypothetical protein
MDSFISVSLSFLFSKKNNKCYRFQSAINNQPLSYKLNEDWDNFLDSAKKNIANKYHGT